MYVRYTCGFPYAKVSIYANNLTFSHRFTLKNCQQLSNRKIIPLRKLRFRSKINRFCIKSKVFFEIKHKKVSKLIVFLSFCIIFAPKKKQKQD